MLKDFQKFILRGNVVDLAVAVVVGAAFNSVVQGLVRDFITPLIQGLGAGKGGFVKGQLYLDHRFTLYWGDFLNTVISFIIIAAVVFFLVVQPINKAIAYANRSKTTEEPTTKKCPFCYSEIAKDASRCAFCTSKLPAEK